MSTEKIRALNDKFRANPYNGLGRFVVTRTVHDMGPEFVAKAVKAVKAFNNFNQGNDPYSEHDFFAFKVDDEDLYFRIDYYDHTLKYGSPDPSNPQVTTRIGTLMMQSDY